MSNAWRVEWSADSLRELTDLLGSFSDRIAMTQAISIAQQSLLNNPERKGIDIAEGLRRLDVAPLVFYYEVDMTQQLTKVVNVRRIS